MTWQNLINPAAALVTDYVDLGHGLVDVAQQTGNLIQGKGFDAGKIFDDSDNPLTEWRINTGPVRDRCWSVRQHHVSCCGGVGIAAQGCTEVGCGRAAEGTEQGCLQLARWQVAGQSSRPRLTTPIKAGREGNRAVTKAPGLNTEGCAKQQGRGPGRADDWLKLTYKDVVNGVVEGGPATVMRSSNRTCGQEPDQGQKVSCERLGEALAWDAFVAFNMAG